MSAKTPHLVQKGSGFYARVRVPVAVRQAFGKTELWTPLHSYSRADAKRKLPSAVAAMKAQIEAALAQTQTAKATAPVARRGRPLAPQQIALSHYRDMVRFDDDARATDHRYAAGFVDADYAAGLKRAATGAASNAELQQLVGHAIGHYEANGNLTAERDTKEWRESAIGLAVAELEALGRTSERDEGDFSGKPSHPILIGPPKIEAPKDSLSHRVTGPDSLKPLKDLLPTLLKDRKASLSTNREMTVTIRMLDEILEESLPVYKITRKEIQTFKRALAEAPAHYVKRFRNMTLPGAIAANKALAKPYAVLDPRTINDKYLSKLHSIFNWCLSNDIVPDNPVSGIKADEPKKDPPRVNFTSTDLSRIFHPDRFKGEWTEAQWAMLVALYTGMRASEQAQIELDNIRTERGVLIFDIERSKTKQPRLVPVHSTLIKLGLNKRIKELRLTGESHLFPDWYRRGMKAKETAERSGKPAVLNDYFPRFIPKVFNNKYLPSVGIHDSRKVWHSFRHTFKTGLALAGVEKSRRDDLCGHKDQSAGGVYIHGTSIEALKEFLERLQFDGFEL
ncbi:MAG TPA: tyrosine-type recombinase/integrase [Pseudolabrys sp.]|nr:tyrosine-type recombinase/integrase [Pseudolabrys sp.]